MDPATSIALAAIVISPYLQVFFERMASGEFDDFFRKRKLKVELLRNLEVILVSVNAVHEDAEDRQFIKKLAVKKWLDELKDAVYDAEDILDKIATKNLRRKLKAEFGTIASKFFTNPISTYRSVKKVENNIKKLLERLNFLLQQTERINPRGGVRGNPSERLTTSFVDESRTFGRQHDKDEIINSLLPNYVSGGGIGVIAIVGMEGIGKTTIAKLVYNDNRLNEYFHLKAWVCVSDDFDVLKLTKKILEEVGLSFDANSTNLNHLQIALKWALAGKKFLLVLDDVWHIKKHDDWELLRNPLEYGAHGSRIIITTCDRSVALAMRANATHPINELPEQYCWSLFVNSAFPNCNFGARLEREFVAIGREIVKNCQGLPLAIKMIGALLSSKLDVKEWEKVLGSELWNLSMEERDVLPALGLSYKYLSPHLKRCFAYCSIFSKDYAFKKDELVLLWMAEGFLQERQGQTMEEVGDEYFCTLVSRSLFKQSSENKYTMHGHVYALAKFISKQFALSFEDDCSYAIGSKIRHLLYLCRSFNIKKFEPLRKDGRLRTIFRLDSFYMSGTQHLSPMIRCLQLRVLILSYNKDISKLPDSIGKLKYLRYLNLSYTMIKRLPDSICKLCNLQILNLSHCCCLTALPREIHKLINLRHLDITATISMEEMPRHLGRLKDLQTLTKFIVNRHSKYGIEELEKLTNLRESLSILELQNIEFLMNAKSRGLRDMKYLKKLVLEWNARSVVTNTSEIQKIVLDSLVPHPYLKSLFIKYYGGISFPNWVGDASFSNIASLHLENCEECCRLPPLGQLPSLQDLSIVGLNGVVMVGLEFYGDGSSSVKPFEALKVLRFKDMLKWEKWFPFYDDNRRRAFPNLRELEIYRCRKLTRGLPVYLPSLAKLELCECPELADSLPMASSRYQLIVENCNKLRA